MGVCSLLWLAFEVTGETDSAAWSGIVEGWSMMFLFIADIDFVLASFHLPTFCFWTIIFRIAQAGAKIFKGKCLEVCWEFCFYCWPLWLLWFFTVYYWFWILFMGFHEEIVSKIFFHIHIYERTTHADAKPFPFLWQFFLLFHVFIFFRYRQVHVIY